MKTWVVQLHKETYKKNLTYVNFPNIPLLCDFGSIRISESDAFKFQRWCGSESKLASFYPPPRDYQLLKYIFE